MVTWSRVSSRVKPSFRDVTCFPVTRKTLVTKENPNMAMGCFWDCKLILDDECNDEYDIYGISFLLKHGFCSFAWIWVQGKLLWRLQNTGMKTTFNNPSRTETLHKLFHKTGTKGKLNNKSCFITKISSSGVVLLLSPKCFWTCLNYAVLCFYNLYSGKFKFLHIARARHCFEQKNSETDFCLKFLVTKRNSNLLEILSHNTKGVKKC